MLPLTLQILRLHPVLPIKSKRAFDLVKYIVQGGQRLEGAVSISGAKNAAVAILPATLLVDGVCRIENVPDISDVRLLLEILNNMGAKIRRLSRNTLEIDCSHVRNATAPIELVRRIRASYYLIGAGAWPFRPRAGRDARRVQLRRPPN